MTITEVNEYLVLAAILVGITHGIYKFVLYRREQALNRRIDAIISLSQKLREAPPHSTVPLTEEEWKLIEDGYEILGSITIQPPKEI